MGGDIHRAFVEIDISAIPDTATLKSGSVKLKIPMLVPGLTVEVQTRDEPTKQPTVDSAQQVFDDIGSDVYTTNMTVSDNGTFLRTLTAAAEADLTAAIQAGQSFWAFAFQSTNEVPTNFVEIDSSVGVLVEFTFICGPFDAVDEDVHSALTEFVDLTDLVGVDRIIAPTRSVNFLELERMMDIHPRIVVLPDFSPMDLQAGSQELIEFRSRYQIALLTNDAASSGFRKIEYQIFRALLRMKKRLRGDGVTTLPKPTPFDYIAPRFTIARLGAEWNQNLDPAKWRGLFEWDVSMTVELADVV